MPIKTIDAKKLKDLMDKGEVVLLDVREPAEYAAENIPAATLLPLDKISKNSLPNISGRKIAIHCRSGGRSMKACEKLLAEDPTLELYNLEGGISAWNEAGNYVARSGKFFLPLDRQVQLAIGLMIIIGSMFAYNFSSAWLLLTGLIGCGLVFAGLTGFCGLAILIAKMPWNKIKKNANSCFVK